MRGRRRGGPRITASGRVARRRGDQAAPLSTGTLQERVLADLMLHPAGRGDVTRWLPATASPPGNNRTMYQLIRLRLDSGRPVDPLIIAWDASTLA